MIKNLCEPEDNSDGSEDEEMPENDGSDEEMETDEEPAGSGDEQDQENENEENDEENEEDEEEEEEEDESNTHPYPTPPPDAVTDDAKANMSLGNGMKKIKIGGSSKPKVVKEKKSKMAASNTDPATDAAKSIKGKTILDLAINAIKALDSKSGSSVISIVAYIKSSGYEMEDQQRFSKTLYKRLKVAVEKGEIEKVKNSFRISMEAKKKFMAIEKMKQKQQREKLKLKEAEDKKAKKVQEKEKKQAKQTKEKEEKKKQKATERKTKESREKKNPKLAAAAGGAKMAAANEAMADLVAMETPTEPVKKPGGKSKALRKSIGTLVLPKGKPKMEQKRIKQLVAGKTSKEQKPEEDVDSENGAPQQSSTPIAPAKQKRNRRAVK